MNKMSSVKICACDGVSFGRSKPLNMPYKENRKCQTSTIRLRNKCLNTKNYSAKSKWCSEYLEFINAKRCRVRHRKQNTKYKTKTTNVRCRTNKGKLKKNINYRSKSKITNYEVEKCKSKEKHKILSRSSSQSSKYLQKHSTNIKSHGISTHPASNIPRYQGSKINIKTQTKSSCKSEVKSSRLRKTRTPFKYVAKDRQKLVVSSSTACSSSTTSDCLEKTNAKRCSTINSKRSGRLFDKINNQCSGLNGSSMIDSSISSLLSTNINFRKKRRNERKCFISRTIKTQTKPASCFASTYQEDFKCFSDSSNTNENPFCQCPMWHKPFSWFNAFRGLQLKWIKGTEYKGETNGCFEEGLEAVVLKISELETRNVLEEKNLFSNSMSFGMKDFFTRIRHSKNANPDFTDVCYTCKQQQRTNELFQVDNSQRKNIADEAMFSGSSVTTTSTTVPSIDLKTKIKLDETIDYKNSSFQSNRGHCNKVNCFSECGCFLTSSIPSSSSTSNEDRKNEVCDVSPSRQLNCFLYDDEKTSRNKQIREVDAGTQYEPCEQNPDENSLYSLFHNSDLLINSLNKCSYFRTSLKNRKNDESADLVIKIKVSNSGRDRESENRTSSSTCCEQSSKGPSDDEIHTVKIVVFQDQPSHEESLPFSPRLRGGENKEGSLFPEKDSTSSESFKNKPEKLERKEEEKSISCKDQSLSSLFVRDLSKILFQQCLCDYQNCLNLTKGNTDESFLEPESLKLDLNVIHDFSLQMKSSLVELLKIPRCCIMECDTDKFYPSFKTPSFDIINNNNNNISNPLVSSLYEFLDQVAEEDVPMKLETITFEYQFDEFSLFESNETVFESNNTKMMETLQSRFLFHANSNNLNFAKGSISSINRDGGVLASSLLKRQKIQEEEQLSCKDLDCKNESDCSFKVKDRNGSFIRAVNKFMFNQNNTNPDDKNIKKIGKLKIQSRNSPFRLLSNSSKKSSSYLKAKKEIKNINSNSQCVLKKSFSQLRIFTNILRNAGRNVKLNDELLDILKGKMWLNEDILKKAQNFNMKTIVPRSFEIQKIETFDVPNKIRTIENITHGQQKNQSQINYCEEKKQPYPRILCDVSTNREKNKTSLVKKITVQNKSQVRQKNCPPYQHGKVKAEKKVEQKKKPRKLNIKVYSGRHPTEGRWSTSQAIEDGPHAFHCRPLLMRSITDLPTSDINNKFEMKENTEKDDSHECDSILPKYLNRNEKQTKILDSFAGPSHTNLQIQEIHDIISAASPNCALVNTATSDVRTTQNFGINVTSQVLPQTNEKNSECNLQIGPKEKEKLLNTVEPSLKAQLSNYWKQHAIFLRSSKIRNLSKKYRNNYFQSKKIQKNIKHKSVSQATKNKHLMADNHAEILSRNSKTNNYNGETIIKNVALNSGQVNDVYSMTYNILNPTIKPHEDCLGLQENVNKILENKAESTNILDKFDLILPKNGKCIEQNVKKNQCSIGISTTQADYSRISHATQCKLDVREPQVPKGIQNSKSQLPEVIKNDKKFLISKCSEFFSQNHVETVQRPSPDTLFRASYTYLSQKQELDGYNPKKNSLSIANMQNISPKDVFVIFINDNRSFRKYEDSFKEDLNRRLNLRGNIGNQGYTHINFNTRNPTELCDDFPTSESIDSIYSEDNENNRPKRTVTFRNRGVSASASKRNASTTCTCFNCGNKSLPKYVSVETRTSCCNSNKQIQICLPSSSNVKVAQDLTTEGKRTVCTDYLEDLPKTQRVSARKMDRKKRFKRNKKIQARGLFDKSIQVVEKRLSRELKKIYSCKEVNNKISRHAEVSSSDELSVTLSCNNLPNKRSCNMEDLRTTASKCRRRKSNLSRERGGCSECSTKICYGSDTENFSESCDSSDSRSSSDKIIVCKNLHNVKSRKRVPFWRRDKKIKNCKMSKSSSGFKEDYNRSKSHKKDYVCQLCSKECEKKKKRSNCRKKCKCKCRCNSKKSKTLLIEIDKCKKNGKTKLIPKKIKVDRNDCCLDKETTYKKSRKRQSCDRQRPIQRYIDSSTRIQRNIDSSTCIQRYIDSCTQCTAIDQCHDVVQEPRKVQVEHRFIYPPMTPYDTPLQNCWFRPEFQFWDSTDQLRWNQKPFPYMLPQNSNKNTNTNRMFPPPSNNHMFPPPSNTVPPLFQNTEVDICRYPPPPMNEWKECQYQKRRSIPTNCCLAARDDKNYTCKFVKDQSSSFIRYKTCTPNGPSIGYRNSGNNIRRRREIKSGGHELRSSSSRGNRKRSKRNKYYDRCKINKNSENFPSIVCQEFNAEYTETSESIDDDSYNMIQGSTQTYRRLEGRCDKPPYSQYKEEDCRRVRRNSYNKLQCPEKYNGSRHSWNRQHCNYNQRY